MDLLEEVLAFFKARLDDDEQAAKLVPQPYRLYVSDEGRLAEPLTDDEGDYVRWADGNDRMPNHINNWELAYDPARTLRKIAADRQLIARYEENPVHEWPLFPILLRIELYDDHPDYREVWRP